MIENKKITNKLSTAMRHLEEFTSERKLLHLNCTQPTIYLT